MSMTLKTTRSASTLIVIRGRTLQGIFEKLMIVKLPHVVDQFEEMRVSRQKMSENRLKWEKSILSNMRGARSIYLPKYYHTVQQQMPQRKGVLCDYIPGPTLHQKMIIQRQTFFAGSRLLLALHIANALSFL